jgi:hypothetical protein
LGVLPLSFEEGPHRRGPLDELHIDFCSSRRGFGIGLLLSGIGLEILAGSLEVGTGGVASVIAGATVIAGIHDVGKGIELAVKSCPRRVMFSSSPASSPRVHSGSRF